MPRCACTKPAAIAKPSPEPLDTTERDLRLRVLPTWGARRIDSITSRDYPVIMGVTLFYAFLIVMSNLAVDIAYGFVDPRIRSSQ